jgi:hypothetical protein
VRTRQGYLALSEPDITPTVQEALVSQAVTNLVEDDRLALTVRVSAAKIDERGRLVQGFGARIVNARKDAGENIVINLSREIEMVSREIHDKTIRS